MAFFRDTVIQRLLQGLVQLLHSQQESGVGPVAARMSRVHMGFRVDTAVEVDNLIRSVVYDSLSSMRGPK